ncbi:MAG: 3'-5' exonuclease [Gammaproteobacteria bacterium]
MTIFVFDIETIPDVENLRKLYDLADLTDEDVVKAAQLLRRQETGNLFIPLHLQRIVAISAVLDTQNQLKVWSLGESDSNEAELINRFYAGIDKYTPTLVSWNGSGFDLPVLHYRALVHGISAPQYWEQGDLDNSFKYNNYLNRYHYRHMDLMDIFSGYQARASAPLNQIAQMLNFPGKMGMHGSLVYEYFQRGEIEAIRNYCETDVLNTYLVYLRFQLIRGQLNQSSYQNKCLQLRMMLESENKVHLNEFLEHWKFPHAETS